MTELKRLPVKYVRDYIKKDYTFKDCCYICGSLEKLELHHLYSVSELWNNWLTDNKIFHDLTVEEVKNLRVSFYETNKDLLGSHNLYTLCDMHHKRLHSIYGAKYSNWRAEKVKIWLENQKQKFGESK